MKKLNSLAVSVALASISFQSQAELQLLDEAALSDVTGQSGITVDVNAKVEIDSLSYIDDGHPLSLEGVKLQSSLDPAQGAEGRVIIDVSEAGELQIAHTAKNTRLQVDEIRVDAANTAPFSFGRFALDFDMTNIFVLSGGGACASGALTNCVSDQGMTLKEYSGRIHSGIANSGPVTQGVRVETNSNGERVQVVRQISEGAKLFYRDDGNDLMVAFDVESSGTDLTLDVVSSEHAEKPNQNAIKISYPDHFFELVVNQIKFRPRGDRPVDPNPNDSLMAANETYGANGGSIVWSGDVSGDLWIYAGGRDPEQGLSFYANRSVSNGQFRYIDRNSQGNSYQVALTEMEHDIDIDYLTFDVIGDSIWLGAKRIQGALDIGGIHVGTEYKGHGIAPVNGADMGRLVANYLFEDQVIDQRTFTNSLRLTPGGNQYGGNKGITIDAEWSLVNADIGYADDIYDIVTNNYGIPPTLDNEKPGSGGMIWVSGINSYGSGRLTVDLIDANFVYADRVVPENVDPFFDGLRLGFENVVGHYSIDGMKVLTAEQAIEDLIDRSDQSIDDYDVASQTHQNRENATLQGGTELLLPLKVFQEAGFTLNGHVTVLPGGKDGDGLTFNGDLHFTDTVLGVTVDADRSGIWLDDVNYDIHMRDAALDVDDQGIVFNKGLYVSKMDIGNVRFGDKETGDSLGRLVISRLEDDSTMFLRSGGAGGGCIGGTGMDSSSCGIDGGRWEDRGDQGVTVGLRSKFIRKDMLSADKAALVSAIDGTDQDPTLKAADTSIAFYRPDGRVGIEAAGISTDENGLYIELGVDVAHTVVKDNDPADGVLKQVMLDTLGNEVYVPPADVEQRLLEGYENPVGFAVDTKVEFSQLNIDRINMIHHTGGEQPLYYGAQFENVSLRANITATPIR